MSEVNNLRRAVTGVPAFPFNKRAYENTLAAQTACNLSGLVMDLQTFMQAIWVEARAFGQGTQYANRHPIVSLFLHQMAHLNKVNCDLLGAQWHTLAKLCEFRALWWEQERQARIEHVLDCLRDEALCSCTAPANVPGDGYADGGDPYSDEELMFMALCNNCQQWVAMAKRYVDAWTEAWDGKE